MEENENKESLYGKNRWKRIKMTEENEEEGGGGCTLILIHPWMIIKNIFFIYNTKTTNQQLKKERKTEKTNQQPLTLINQLFLMTWSKTGRSGQIC